MKRTLGIIGIATLTLGLSTSAMAQGRGPGAIHSEQCLASLPLTYPQQREIDTFRAAAIRQASLVRGQIDRTEAELRRLTLMRRPSPMAIAYEEAQLRNLRDRQQGIWSTYRIQVEAVLGPMQRLAWNRCSAPGPVPAHVAPAWHNPSGPVVAVRVPDPRPVAPTPMPMARPMGRR
jgi:hypothetical protein